MVSSLITMADVVWNTHTEHMRGCTTFSCPVVVQRLRMNRLKYVLQVICSLLP
jgi:hypothetical protein